MERFPWFLFTPNNTIHQCVEGGARPALWKWGFLCLPAAGCRGRALASTSHTPTLKLNEPRTFIECWWLVVTGQSTLHSAPQFTHHLPPPLPPPCRLTGCNYRSSPHKFQSIVLNPFNNQGKFTNLRAAAGQLAIIFVGT